MHRVVEVRTLTGEGGGMVFNSDYDYQYFMHLLHLSVFCLWVSALTDFYM